MAEQKALSSVAVMGMTWTDARQSTPPDAGTSGSKPQIDWGRVSHPSKLCAWPAFLAHQPSLHPTHTHTPLHTHTLLHSLLEKELGLNLGSGFPGPQVVTDGLGGPGGQSLQSLK